MALNTKVYFGERIPRATGVWTGQWRFRSCQRGALFFSLSLTAASWPGRRRARRTRGPGARPGGGAGRSGATRRGERGSGEWDSGDRKGGATAPLGTPRRSLWATPRRAPRTRRRVPAMRPACTARALFFLFAQREIFCVGREDEPKRGGAGLRKGDRAKKARERARRRRMLPGVSVAPTVGSACVLATHAPLPPRAPRRPPPPPPATPLPSSAEEPRMPPSALPPSVPPCGRRIAAARVARGLTAALWPTVLMASLAPCQRRQRAPGAAGVGAGRDGARRPSARRRTCRRRRRRAAVGASRPGGARGLRLRPDGLLARGARDAAALRDRGDGAAAQPAERRSGLRRGARAGQCAARRRYGTGLVLAGVVLAKCAS